MTTISLENAKEPKKPKIATFPKESFVNEYHFMRVGPDVLMALGWQITGKRLSVEPDLKDGALIVRKPSKQPLFFGECEIEKK